MHKQLVRPQRGTIVVCVIFFVGFLLITFFRPSLHALDVTINQWVLSIQSSGITFLAQGIALIFDTVSLVFISIIIAGLLFLRHHKPEGLLLLGAMGGDALLIEIIKNVDRAARPTDGLVSSSGFSYPSGHAAGVVVFAGILAYFAWRHWQSRRSRVIVGAGFGALAGIVGFDRIYLNVHWLSDVLGG